jgi:WD40 repeat protein
MWLLRTELNEDGNFTPVLDEYEGQDIPAYAILSHTWGEGEVLFSDVSPNPQHAFLKKSFPKVENAAERARLDGLAYIWIDTCCIKKESSAELQEAINSMYDWYARAVVCYVFLADFTYSILTQQDEAFEAALHCSRWFTRGWCLQELLAPDNVVFFSSDWTEIGTKASMAELIVSITSIDVEYLTRPQKIHSASVAKRMSWAAHRQTRRVEDIAYCLMGIFSVNLPMLYGEGTKAFLRLQEAIWERYEDQSLFMWANPHIAPDTPHGLLADSPVVFADSGPCCSFDHEQGKSNLKISSKGVRIQLQMQYAEKKCYYAGLNCPVALDPGHATQNIACIYLQKLDWGDEQFVRIHCNHLGHLRYNQGSLQSVFIPQQIHETDTEQILYPRQSINFRHNIGASREGDYALVDLAYEASATRPCKEPELTSPTSNREVDILPWIFKPFPRHLEILDSPMMTVTLLFRRRQDGEKFVIQWATDQQSRLAFCALPTELRTLESMSGGASDLQVSLNSFRQDLKPLGSVIQLQKHHIEVLCEITFSNALKTFNIDFNLEPIWNEVKTRTREINTIDGLSAAWMAEPTFQFHFKKLRTLKNHWDPVKGIAFSPDGKQLAFIAHSRSVWFWDTVAGTFSMMWVSDAIILEMVFSPDGSKITCVCCDGSVCLWNRATRENIRISKIDGDKKLIAAVFSPDGKKILSASTDNSVQAWNTTTGTTSGTFKYPAHKNQVVTFSPDASLFACRLPSSEFQIMDSNTGAVYSWLGVGSRTDSMVAFSPDGKQFAIASKDIRLYNTFTGNLRHVYKGNVLKGGGYMVSAIAFSPDGKQMSTASISDHIRLWNTVTGAEDGISKERNGGRILCINYSPDGKQLACVLTHTRFREAWLWTTPPQKRQRWWRWFC